MKTKLFGLFWVLCLSLPLLAQQKPPVKLGEDGVYEVSENMPEYPGGQAALMEFLGKNMKYPRVAQENGVSGRVIVQFVILEDGSISNAKIVRGVDEHLDAEALRVVNLMPKWIPGTVEGRPVKVKFTVPLMFRLTGGNSTNTPVARMNVPSVPKIVIPVGQIVKNKKLVGVWQNCNVDSTSQGYQLTMQPILKIWCGKTFTNVFYFSQMMPVSIMAQGDCKLKGKNLYEEKMKQSVSPIFPVGAKNIIKVDYLHDNLLRFTFDIPNQSTPWVEYWYRSSVPNLKLNQ